MVVGALARRVTDLPRAGVGLVVATGQRVVALVAGAEFLVERAAVLIDRLELLLDRLEIEAIEVQGLVDRIEPLPGVAAEALTEVREIALGAAATRALAEEQVQRLRRLVDDYEAPLRALAPLLVQASRELHPRHLAGIASLLDQLPGLVNRLEPALTSMAELAPEMEAVTERMDNVGQVVEGLPGAKALRRRGKAREESED